MSARSATTAGPTSTSRRELVEHFGDKVKTSFVENVAEGADAERVIRNLAKDGYGLVFTTPSAT